jgi:ribonuclease HI
MTDMKATIERIYTDGACSGNPGPGGWGTVVYFSDSGIQELGGGDRATTNNRMELQAAIDGLAYYVESGQTQPIVLYTDSEYVKNGITKWISGWKKKGWKTSTGKPVLNQDLWEALDKLHSSQVEWRYVKGHSGNEGNERCDEIARSFSHNSPIPLKQYQPGQVRSVSTPVSTPVATPVEPKNEPKIEPKIEPNVSSPVKAITDPETELGLSDMQTLRESIERLRIADETATHHYLLTTQELAILLQLTPKTVSTHKEDWVWRNWLISRVREESHQTLWQLERVDDL